MATEASGDYIQVGTDFPGDVLGPVPFEDARRRVLAYCTDPTSGWGVYDLTGIIARRSGVFDSVTPWSLLLANAINGQVKLENVADFHPERREDFARRIAAIPPDADLRTMNDRVIEAVTHACSFGYPGVKAPKITKVGALYRPRSIPMLDGHVSLAFGFGAEGFSEDGPSQSPTRREKRIDSVVHALADSLQEHQRELDRLRADVEHTVPEIRMIPDLRLLDLVIWTSQDDRMDRSTKRRNRWRDAKVEKRIPLEDFEPVPLRQ